MQGEYADTLQIQTPQTRDTEQGRAAVQLSRAQLGQVRMPVLRPDGKLRRRRVQATELGSAFAYEVAGNDTYLLTNEHVAAGPRSPTLHKIDGVQDGCKRVEDKLRIVRDERDDFEPGQIRSAASPSSRCWTRRSSGQPAAQRLPTASARAPACARQRRLVRGSRSGHAGVSSGKIVNPYDAIRAGLDHVDFVIDALLSEGNSGSPVCAVVPIARARAGGMYHAGYKGTAPHSWSDRSAGRFMHKKKRVRARCPRQRARVVGVADRARLRASLTEGRCRCSIWAAHRARRFRRRVLITCTAPVPARRARRRSSRLPRNGVFASSGGCGARAANRRQSRASSHGTCAARRAGADERD